MSLEWFSNELFLEIFEYLSTVDLLRSFSSLNVRLTNLLAFHLQTYPCSFQSSSKYHFDLICQHDLPSLFDRISSLRLSDHAHTPNQIDRFFSFGFSFRQFHHLTSLSLGEISSFNCWKTILMDIPHLSQLTHLSLSRYVILFNEDYDIHMIDCLNRLSKLLSCHLDITHDSVHGFSTPAIHSSSLKYLSLPYLECTVSQFFTLIAHIPNLQWIKGRISDSSKISPTSRSYPSIKTLKLTFEGSFIAINHLLSSIPNLETFQIHMPSSYIDGYQWCELIDNHLSKLKIFQLKMLTYIKSRKTREEEIEIILQSFRSPFWFEEHHWFIQCYYSTLPISSMVYVYTLPCSFPDLYYLDDAQVKSTSSINHSFVRVHNLYFTSALSTRGSPIHLNEIRCLHMNISFDDFLRSMVGKFDRLETLQIDLTDQINETTISIIQTLLDQMKHLRSFGLTSWIEGNLFPIQLKHPFIRQLDLRQLTVSYADQCSEQLTQSSIVQQCQILSLRMHQPIDILSLIHRLENLQSLTIKCHNCQTLTTIAEFLQRNSFSPSILPHTDEIRLWLR